MDREVVGLERIALVQFSRRWASVFAPILTFPQRGKGQLRRRIALDSRQPSPIKGEGTITSAASSPRRRTFPHQGGKGHPHLRRPRLADELSPIKGEGTITSAASSPCRRTFPPSRGKGLMQFSRLKHARLHPLFACANFQRERTLPLCEFDTGCMPCPPTTSSL